MFNAEFYECKEKIFSFKWDKLKIDVDFFKI